MIFKYTKKDFSNYIGTFINHCQRVTSEKENIEGKVIAWDN
jgi:hypothetical protein